MEEDYVMIPGSGTKMIKNGRKVINARRAKGRKSLTV